MKLYSANDTLYRRLRSSNNEFYFVLNNENAKAIGKSRLYETEQDRDNAIEVVKLDADGAEIIDKNRKMMIDKTVERKTSWPVIIAILKRSLSSQAVDRTKNKKIAC